MSEKPIVGGKLEEKNSSADLNGRLIPAERIKALLPKVHACRTAIYPASLTDDEDQLLARMNAPQPHGVPIQVQDFV